MILLANFIQSLRRILICAFFIQAVSFKALCFKLSSPSVLLPYNKGLPSNFTLEVTGTNEKECFKWRSENPRIVHVTPLYLEDKHHEFPPCSKKAILSSVANLLERKVTEISVTGEDGKEVYCNVITDIPAAIELEVITQEVVLGGLPQKISLIAKDDQGHKFSSISGLQVEWKIVASYGDQSTEIDDSDKDSVISISRFDESDYASPDDGKQLEQKGLLASSVLVYPLQLGTAAIKASLLFSGLPVLETEEVILKVIPNLKVHPSSPMYLLRHASANMEMEKLKGEGNDLDFAAVAENSTVVTLTEDFSKLYAKEHGSTIIKLKNNYGNAEMKIHVVKLARIGFRISSGDYNILEEMKIHEVFADLFDENGNKIYPSNNLRLSVSFPTKLFHVIHTSSNGTYFIVQTIAPGHGKVRAEFKGIVMEDDTIFKEGTVSATLDVTVCQKLTIFPPYILLPVLPERPMHRIPLTITGGTGRYVWSLSNNAVAKVIPVAGKSNAVHLEIFEEVYDLTITAADEGNINLITKARVSVQTPLDIEAYPSVTEAEVGNVLMVPVALLGYEDKGRDIIRKFDDCSKSLIKVDIVEKFVLTYEKEANLPAFGKGCQSLQFRCKLPGHSRINMEYAVNTSTNNVTFKTTSLLACYKLLKPVHPVRVTVLPLGSSMEVAFEGGPRRWPLFKESHYTELDPSDPDLVKIELIKDPVRYNKDLTVFRVLCKSLGENILTLRIGNNPSATLKHPAKSEESIKFICSDPHSLHLKLFKQKSKRALRDENIVKVPFYGDKNFEVDIFVKDNMGRKFANISSLRVAWDVSDRSLANPVKHFDFVTHENAVSGYRKLSRNFNEFKMKGLAGDLKVEAKITSYRKEVLAKEGINEYKEFKEISRTIDLKLVSLRDINSGLYDATDDKKEEEYCEKDSCTS